MKRRLLAGAFGAFGLMAAGLFMLDRVFPPDLSRLRAVGTEVDDRQGRVVAFTPTADGMWRLAATADAVPPLFLDLLIAAEDHRFYRHPGVDPLAILRGAWQWARAGRVVSGGSTLTMQVARLLEKRPRGLRAKLIEAFRALQLEARFGKREILGMWLTLAPFGGNLEGVRAASYAWLGHAPSALTPAEAALLVALPRRPEALRPDRHPEAAAAARSKVLASGARAGVLGPTEFAGTPVPLSRRRMPRAAPQFVAGLGRQGPRVATTLDLPLQQALERLATEQLRAMPPRTSLAFLVADANAREIRALIGGAPWDVADRGERAAWLDLSRAVRSPGSALKPFIYALAFADGYAAPGTSLADLPKNFAGYAPENFLHAFAGRVTAAEALRRSLNLPAVGLLQRVGPLRFAAALGEAGAKLRLPFGAAASLPLALGGAGITLREMAGLYAALATDGSAAPLVVVSGGTAAARPFLDPAAARMVADILTRPLPDGGPAGVAWKTGTSWGGRDAWALGFDARQVVGVWVGRPDGTAMPGGTGGGLALPVLERVFALLPAAPRAVQPMGILPARADPVHAEALRLLFPPPGAVLARGGTVPIRAMGGRRPLVFLVDGAPIPSELVRRETAWKPPDAGFYRLAVIDSDGQTAHVEVRVQ